MNKENIPDQFLNSDHQQTLATIKWLNNCQTWDEFNQAVKAALLPLLKCNGAFYGRLMGEQNALQLLGSINQSTCCQHGWKQLLNIASQELVIADSVNSHAAEPLPISAVSDVQCFEENGGHYRSFDLAWQQSHRNCTVVKVFDEQHQLAFQFYFCRLSNQQQVFSQRDFELLKILKPILLQTLRLILFRQETFNSRLTKNFWSSYTDPITVFRSDGQVIFQSCEFDRVFAQEKQAFLSSMLALIDFLQSNKINGYSFLSQLGKRLYEIKLTLIDADADSRSSIYLLHPSRITHKFGKVFNQLDRTRLTHREMEITVLICQGRSAREIAEEIHLSYHTVRNHIKSIYSKLGVSTRSELLSSIE
ncbi:MAG: DNA-binding response regulator [Nitrosomonas sp.]|uniref:response regulator transcription factor n=1 Tax=Nitrosomonas sp. TaxID=42353 RepID=UPI0032F03496